jgi:hypothetical protein
MSKRGSNNISHPSGTRLSIAQGTSQLWQSHVFGFAENMIRFANHEPGFDFAVGKSKVSLRESLIRASPETKLCLRQIFARLMSRALILPTAKSKSRFASL